MNICFTQITGCDDTVVIGLHFLKTISEEWPNCKDEISTERKEELKVLLTQECRRIFDLLQRKLAAMCIFTEKFTY
jgi:hypothetical protein